MKGQFCNKQFNKSKHHVIYKSLTLLGVHLVSIFIKNYTEIIFGSFGNRQVNKSRHYVLAILLGLFRYHYV